MENFDPNIPMDAWEFDDPNEELFFAITWATTPGVSGNFLDKIKRSVERGADINGISDEGTTPLTAAIDGSSPAVVKIVQLIIQLGADPSKRDKNGYMPWTACMSRVHDNVVAETMLKVRQLLVGCGANQDDETLLQFDKAVKEGNIKQVKEFLSKKIDIHSPLLSALHIAVSNSDVEMVKLLIDNGFDINVRSHQTEGETCLISAARDGNLDMVKLLVELGADINLYAWEDPHCTAENFAKEEGHKEIAEWLRENMPDMARNERKEKEASVPEKFKLVYAKKTNGINCDITNDDLINKLNEWDDQYKVQVRNIEHDRLTVMFHKIPDDLEKFAQEVYEFCPDIIDQGFGCIDEMLEMAEEAGQAIEPEIIKLLEGIDFSDENYGLKLLAKDFQNTRTLELWWD